MNEMIDDVCSNIIDKKRNMPYALFGYSMGTLICYEISFEIKKRISQDPLHIFFSANLPPNLMVKNDSMQFLENDDIFINKIMEYGGIPNEVFAESELMDLLLPIFKSDFKNVFQYKFLKKGKYNFDISVLYSDFEDKEDVYKWSDYTKGKCNYYYFKGSHFFIYNNIEKITDIINNTLG